MIYVIKCEHNCYYVGKTDRGAERILEHLAEVGSQWTRLHKPLEIVEQIQGDGFIEDAVTKRYMSLYGIESVRGGSYCQLELSTLDRQQLIRELRGAADCCFHCGLTGHFVQDCPSKATLFQTDKQCQRCGREHETQGCYAKRHLDGRFLGEKKLVQKSEPVKVICDRCGRNHKTSSCYAARHLDGRILEKRIATQPAPNQADPALVIKSDPAPNQADPTLAIQAVPAPITKPDPALAKADAAPIQADPDPKKPKENNCVVQ